MTFDTILGCIMIPIAIVFAYIAGKRNLLDEISEMISEAAEERKNRKLSRYSFFRDNTELLKKADEQGYLSGFDFSVLMQRYLISEDGYVIDTGNYENVNAEVALRLERKIRQCPELWRFFMVA